MSPEAIRRIQETGIDWEGNPLTIDGKTGPKTNWWLGILSLPEQRQLIVRTALSWYKKRVHEDAGRPNRGQYVDMFTSPGGIGNGIPWCAAFVSHVIQIDCGDEDWPYMLSAEKIISWAKVNNRIITEPLPGDVFAFLYPDSTTGEGHCGFVLGANADWIADCDGNVGDAVAVGRRARAGLIFIRTVPIVPCPTMPTVLDLKMLDGARARTR